MYIVSFLIFIFILEGVEKEEIMIYLFFNISLDSMMGHSFQCPDCDKNYTHKTNLQDHIRTIHKGEKITCTECDYKATNKSNISRHINSGNIPLLRL